MIPTNRKVYMIGETHLDGGRSYVKSKEELTVVRNALISENEIRGHLVDKCDVTHFVFEAPVSNEYFYNKFLQTGDSSWIRVFLNAEYQIGVIRNVVELAKTKEKITISCIDADRSIYAPMVIDVLFWLTFFEPFPELFKPYTSTGAPVYGYMPFAPDLLETAFYSEEPIFPFVDYVWNARTQQIDTSSENLYKVVSNTITNKIIMTELEAFYGKNFEYVKRVLYSYYYAYNLSPDILLDLENREQLIYNNFEYVRNKYPSGSFCIQIGAYHVMPNKTDVLSSYINNDMGLEPFNIYSIAESNAYAAKYYLKNLNYKFEGCCCYSKLSNNELLLRIK